MRFALNQKHVATVSVLILFTLLFSCHSRKFLNEKGNPKIIRIEGGDIASDTLTLRHGNNSPAAFLRVAKGRMIKWSLHPNPVVKAIDSVYAKTGSKNIFSVLPARDGQSQNWQGRIDPDAESGTIEDYNIDWTDTAGIKRTYDPKIQVK